MKIFIASLLSFVSVSWMSASLDDILAPLPVAAPTESTKVSTEATQEQANEADIVSAPAVASQAISEQSLHDALQNALQERFQPAGELRITLLRKLPDLSEHEGPFILSIVNAPNRLSRNNSLVRFEVENANGVVGQFAIPFRPQVLSPVWFVKAHLRKGDALERGDFERRHEDLLKEPDAVTTDWETLLRHEYGRDVTPGKPLAWSDIRERSLVRKGEVVDVTMTKGLLGITMRAMARQDGANGDIITLRNMESSKDFAGRVVGINKVNVVF